MHWQANLRLLLVPPAAACSKHILRGATFKIRRGEAVGIIGSSGTGKSTTLRLAAGLLEPDRVRALQLPQAAGSASQPASGSSSSAVPARGTLHAAVSVASHPSIHWSRLHHQLSWLARRVGLPQGEVLIKGAARQGLISDDDTSDKLKVGLVFQVGRAWVRGTAHPLGRPGVVGWVGLGWEGLPQTGLAVPSIPPCPT